MALVASSAQALAAALLRSVQELDVEAAVMPPGVLNCAAQLGALYCAVAGQGTVRFSRRW